MPRQSRAKCLQSLFRNILSGMRSAGARRRKPATSISTLRLEQLEDRALLSTVVDVTSNLNVRTGPGTGYAEIGDPDYPGYAPAGTVGEIRSGPVNADGYSWLNVDYGPGLYTGWSADTWLEKVRSTPNQPAFDIGDAATLHQTTLTLYIHKGTSSGPSVSGVYVTGQDAAGHTFEQTSDGNGAVVLTGKPEDWQFTISKNGYEPVSWTQAITQTTTRHAFFAYVPPPPVPKAEPAIAPSVSEPSLTSNQLDQIAQQVAAIAQKVSMVTAEVNSLTAPIALDSSGANASPSSSISVTGVSPSQPQATDGRQNFTIYGRDFESSAYVNLYDNGGELHTLSGARIISHSSTHITVNPNFTSDGAGTWHAQVVNGSGRSSGRYSFQVMALATTPTVNAFDVTSRVGVVGQPFTLLWTVSDTGGSGLNRVELWRANDSGGTPVGWVEVKRTPVSGNGPSSGSFTDAPTSTGSYWYGIHVVDKAGKWSAEPSPLKVMLSQQPATAKPNNSTAGPLKFDHGKVLENFPLSSLDDEPKNALNQILTFIENDPEITDVRWAAYMLATVKAEVGDNWEPVAEYGQISYFDQYEPGTDKGKWLGNVIPGDGYLFRGRGYVQLTGRGHYQALSEELNLDLINHPELALDPSNAYQIMSYGMRKGTFRPGETLAKHIKGETADYKNARKIVNGLDRADEIKRDAQAFEKILTDSTLVNGNESQSSREQNPNSTVISPPKWQEVPPFDTGQPATGFLAPKWHEIAPFDTAQPPTGSQVPAGGGSKTSGNGGGGGGGGAGATEPNPPIDGAKLGQLVDQVSDFGEPAIGFGDSIVEAGELGYVNGLLGELSRSYVETAKKGDLDGPIGNLSTTLQYAGVATDAVDAIHAANDYADGEASLARVLGESSNFTVNAIGLAIPPVRWGKSAWDVGWSIGVPIGNLVSKLTPVEKASDKVYELWPAGFDFLLDFADL